MSQSSSLSSTLLAVWIAGSSGVAEMVETPWNAGWVEFKVDRDINKIAVVVKFICRSSREV